MNRNSNRSMNDRNYIFYIYVIAMLVFAGVTAWFKMYPLAITEASVALVLVIVTLVSRAKHRRDVEKYIESVVYETENAKNNTLMNFPLPIAAFRLNDTRIVWGNSRFFNMCGIDASLESRMSDLIPDFSMKWLTEGKNACPSVVLVAGRKYKVNGNLVGNDNPDEEQAYMGVTYWVDVTDYDNIRLEYFNSRPVAGIIIFDNYDDLCKNQPERVKNDIREALDDKLNAFAEKNNAIIRRYERDRYLLICEKRYLDSMREEKFQLIEAVHRIENPQGITASISIGIGTDASGFSEAMQYAGIAGELALSRGGDQAVIKNKLSFEFFGGRGLEIEKRTKVKSRVIASTFSELVCDSSKVYIMGHKYADFDCIGSAAGICCICRKCGVEAKIIVDRARNASSDLINMLAELDEYADVFISSEEAMLKADGKTLLVVLDTNRPEQVEDRDLLESCNRIAVIDHHRIAATNIGNAAMTFVEPYASSTGELVTEMVMEVVGENGILQEEAAAILAGIVLDTKSFTIRTGDRTFDAASYLRRKGADTTDVKKLMQSGMEDTVDRYKIMQTAVLYRNVAIAAPSGSHSRVVAAKASDELLNISGVEASVVIASDGDKGSFVSARSIGEMNVQILMEKLGGGGNRSVAAAQFPNDDVETVLNRVCKAIDEYLDN